MEVVFYPDAEDELDALPPAERAAMLAAVEKLMVRGDQLSYPHSSAVRGARARYGNSGLVEDAVHGGPSIVGSVTSSSLQALVRKHNPIHRDFGAASPLLNADLPKSKARNVNDEQPSATCQRGHRSPARTS